MSEELKPCPFCGGEAWLNDYEAKHSDLPPMNRNPSCTACGANLGYWSTQAAATAAWNTRAAPKVKPLEWVTYPDGGRSEGGLFGYEYYGTRDDTFNVLCTSDGQRVSTYTTTPQQDAQADYARRILEALA